MLRGETLAESAPRSKDGVTIVDIKRTGEDFTYARPETSVERHDHLIVSGPTAKVEKFCHPVTDHDFPPDLPIGVSTRRQHRPLRAI